jgi:hypothetical protein
MHWEPSVQGVPSLQSADSPQHLEVDSSQKPTHWRSELQGVPSLQSANSPQHRNACRSQEPRHWESELQGVPSSQSANSPQHRNACRSQEPRHWESKLQEVPSLQGVPTPQQMKKLLSQLPLQQSLSKLQLAVFARQLARVAVAQPWRITSNVAAVYTIRRVRSARLRQPRSISARACTPCNRPTSTRCASRSQSESNNAPSACAGGEQPDDVKAASRSVSIRGEEPVLHRIRQLHRKPRGRERLSYAGIADQLNAERLPTRTGKAWRAGTVRRIVRRAVTLSS